MISVYKPKLYTEEVLEELRPVLDSGWVGLGPKVKEFETALQEHIGGNTLFSALNSCTSALHIAIRMLDLPKGSKVLTTPITFVSTNHVLLYEGLEPVFCDVEPLTGNMDVNYALDAIEKYDIKAIVLVHNGGYPADMDGFNAIKQKTGIPIVEDCAHAFGSTYNGKKIGQSNNICAWSFQAVKNLCVGDGGALSTNNPKYLKRINTLRWLGIDRDTITRSSGGYNWKYDVVEIGYKYHMCDIIATVGLVQLRHIEEDNARRKEIAEFYYNNLKNITLPDYNKERQSAYWFAPIFVENQKEVYQKLVENNIYPSVHFVKNNGYRMYKDFIQINDCKNAEWYQEHVLSLPIHLYLQNEDLQKIVDTINSI